jgi:hypothetical protein
MSRFKAEVASTRARMLQVSALLAAIVQNHPGHDQKSHGRKGGRDLTRDHETLARIYHANVDDNGQWVAGGPSDRALVALADEQGFTDRPTSMNSEEFDAVVASGDHVVMFRGVKATDDMTAAEIHAQTREGDYAPGVGVFGNGYYMASGATGEAKAGTFADGTPGSLGRYALRPDARTITYTELRGKFGEYYESGYRRDPLATKAMNVDFGRFAMALGYDAIHVPVGTPLLGGGGTNGVQREEYVILNRGMLIADAGP